MLQGFFVYIKLKCYTCSMDLKKQLDTICIVFNEDNHYPVKIMTERLSHRFFGANDELLMVSILDENEVSFDFAFFRPCNSVWDEINNKEIDCMELLWWGCGTVASLRELRHSYFPEYVFYIRPSEMIAISNILLEYFDDI